MTGADGAAGPDAQAGWQWDVALSFAGAQRPYVEQVASALQARGVRCFYDADEQIELWGKYLAEELPDIYAERAAAVVVFVSAEYAARDWTRLERRAALNRAVRERREYVLPARFDDTPLPGLLSDLVAIDLGGRSPQQFAAMIADKLARLATSASAPTVDAGDPARDVEPAPPAGAVRAGDADPRRLGVHAAISVPGVADDVLPEYVPRDTDADEHGVRAKVAAAAERGGFVLLVGGSSVGKTRCAAEAILAVLPDWWLVHPSGPDPVAALAQVPSRRMVVWLNELQDYLDGEHGLTAAVVRALLNHPAVIIGTLWPERYAAYTTVPALAGADPYGRERQVLDLADVVRIGPEFSEAEQDRARAAAARDPRLRVALGAGPMRITQILAAAPQLVARWEGAQTVSPYAWAVLTAALDMARLGARAPLSADLLRAAAPGYCTSAQQAEAPGNWFEQALAYATEKLHGAVAALSPVGSGMGRIAGYTAADYLIQHASRERRYARLPASTWDAVLSNIRDPADATRLAGSARDRLLYRYAIPLYRHAANVGDEEAIRRLANLLTGCGDLDGAKQILRLLADAGHESAALQLVDLLTERGDLDGLRALADAGHESATLRLSALLTDRGDLDGAEQILRPLADAGHGFAAEQIADLVARRGDLDGAEQILRALADADHEHAAAKLADLLANRGDLDEAVQILRVQANAGDGYAAWLLTDLLAMRGDMSEAEQILRSIADAGHEEVASELADRLADLLVDDGDLDEAEQILRAQAAIGDESAAVWLADLLVNRDDMDGLRARAAAGDKHAAGRLADLVAEQLADRGDLDGLRARADAGDVHAALRLADLLADRGDVDGLRARIDAGDAHAAGRLDGLLADRGDVDGLRARADAGDGYAAFRLVDLLVDRGDVDGLRALAGVGGDEHAAGRLADLLADRGDVDGLRARIDAGDEHAAGRLADLLADRGDVDGLRARIDAGDEHAAGRLPELLIKQGRGEEAERLRRFGLNPDGSIADA